MDILTLPVATTEFTNALPASPHECHIVVPSLVELDKLTFLDLLADIKKRSAIDGPNDIIAVYRSWIECNGETSLMMFAAWFNLGVALATAGDRDGAIKAYRHVLTLKPGYHPAAFNLGLLLNLSGRTDDALTIWQEAQNTTQVLHVGCGTYHPLKLPSVFRNAGWREIRFDIDVDVSPDIVANITDMGVISDLSIDVVYSSHNLEHLHSHEVLPALREMYRVSKFGGFTLIILPDLQEVARHILEGGLENPLYTSPMGPVAPIDVLYGHRQSIASGNLFMAHHTGFTDRTLGNALIKAGFAAVLVQRSPWVFSLTAIAFRSRPSEEDLTRAQALLQDLPDNSNSTEEACLKEQFYLVS